MLAPLLLAVSLAAPAVLQDPGAGTIRGVVTSAATGEPLVGAIVRVDGGVSPGWAAADSAGRYRLTGVAPGRRMLRVASPDHSPLDVEVWVPPGAELVVDLELELRPILLPAVTAVAEPGVEPAREPARTPERGLVGPRAIEASTPGIAEIGLGEAGRGTPGHEPVDPSDVLYVRGSAADLKLVLVDGAPVQAPFHIGGLLEPFEAGTIQSANLYLGGAPARYDGGLSYILDLRTGATRRAGFEASAAADLLGYRGVAGGALGGRGGFLAAVRSVHGGAAPGYLDQPFPYAYTDALARADLDLGGELVLGVTGFLNRESVRLDISPDEPLAEWGNAATSVRLRGSLAGTGFEVTAAGGAFRARLPTAGSNAPVLEGSTARTRLVADFSRDVGELHLRWGAAYDRQEIGVADGRKYPGAGASGSYDRAAAAAAAAYVEGAFEPAHRVRVRAGLRGESFSYAEAPRLAPRVAVSWLVSDRAVLSLAAGRYHQQVRSPTFASTAPPDSGVSAVGDPFTLARATHVVVGLDQEIGQGVRLGVEGFLKEFDGLPGPGPADARSSGLDLWLQGGRSRVHGWFGYSLAWVWAADGPQSSTSVFSGRHIVTTGVGASLGESGRLEVRLAYGAGLPYAAIPILSPEALEAPRPPRAVAFVANARDDRFAESTLGGAPDEPYLRLDAELSRSWSPVVAGRSTRVTPYLRILNALDRRDALFYLRDGGAGGQPRALAPLPVLPVVGLEWRF